MKSLIWNASKLALSTLIAINLMNCKQADSENRAEDTAVSSSRGSSNNTAIAVNEAPNYIKPKVIVSKDQKYIELQFAPFDGDSFTNELSGKDISKATLSFVARKKKVHLKFWSDATNYTSRDLTLDGSDRIVSVDLLELIANTDEAVVMTEGFVNELKPKIEKNKKVNIRITDFDGEKIDKLLHTKNSDGQYQLQIEVASGEPTYSFTIDTACAAVEGSKAVLSAPAGFTNCASGTILASKDSESLPIGALNQGKLEIGCSADFVAVLGTKVVGDTLDFVCAQE